MLRFKLFGFPIAIEPWFWLTMFILGRMFFPSEQGGGSIVSSLVIFTSAAFTSILIHELGHAFAARAFECHQISLRLVAMGGLCSFVPPRDKPLSRMQSVIISAAGPIVQLIFGFASLVVIIFFEKQVHPTLLLLLEPFMLVSLLWGLLNLILPIFPLDGGQILAGILGPKNIKLTLIIGLIVCAALAVPAWFYTRSLWNIFLLVILASQNIRLLQAINEQEKKTPPVP